MKRMVVKPRKVALCRVCHGTGRYEGGKTCPQCGGSGRVTVSCRMELDIQPYRENEE